MYLAQALGLDTTDMMTNFVFEKTKTYIYPNSSIGIFPPQADLSSFPGLQQTYWSIIAQFTASSEPSLRSGRSLLGRIADCHFS